VIALIGNLARDLRQGRPPQTGGGPFHGARALQRLQASAQIVTRCANADRDALLPALTGLGIPVRTVPGEATATFSFSYEGERRAMRIEVLGDAWLPGDVGDLPPAVGWVHVAPLARSEFPPETLAALGRRWPLSLDGQGLVRVPRVGPLRLDASFDPELLRHVRMLKLADEEAEVLGDVSLLAVPEVVVTHGSRGATLYLDGRRVEVPAQPLDGDPTGAGDAFATAYAVARDGGVDPAEAARRATELVASLLAG